jgi:GT2 family glycosyltransferase
MIKSSTFAAFIMTYQRNSTLENTIHDLLEQTFPPQKILIIDNDPDQGASVVAEKLSNLPVAYYAVGYNSGPAGAAKIGLEILAKEGYDWIGWIDDDDPPVFNDTFEMLITLAKSKINCGCVGTVGQRFNRKNGLIIRVSDSELEGNGFIEVDNIAGNMCKIVNAKAILDKKVLPAADLFFGFEELDFDLRLQNAGYRLLTDRGIYKKHRVYYNRTNLEIKRGIKKPTHRLWREYYSTRNSLMVLYKNKLYLAMILSLMRYSFKIISGFKFGIKYGFTNAVFLIKGIIHFLIGKTGKTILV